MLLHSKKILTSCITHKVQRKVISWFICLVLFASCNILSCSSLLATNILSPQSNCRPSQVGLCISDQIFTLYLPFLDILYQCAYVSFVQCLKDELVDSPDFQCAGWMPSPKKRHPFVPRSVLLFLFTFRRRGGVQPQLSCTFPCTWFTIQHHWTIYSIHQHQQYYSQPFEPCAPFKKPPALSEQPNKPVFRPTEGCSSLALVGSDK